MLKKDSEFYSSTFLQYIYHLQKGAVTNRKSFSLYLLDAVTSSRITFVKQKLDRAFNFIKHYVIDFTKFSNRTMCRASEAKSQK